MPAALERKLKRQVAGKKMSKERKDAYVYGTLRKTGWKPSREKKMSIPSKTTIEFGLKPAFTGISNPTSPEVMKLHRKLFTDLDKLTGDPEITHKVLATSHKHNLAIRGLTKLSSRLESIIRFDDDDDKNKSSLLGNTAQGAALVGAGVGGTLGHQWVKRQGGYGAVFDRLKGGAGQAAGQVGQAAGQVGQAAGNVGKTATQAGQAVGQAAKAGAGAVASGAGAAKLGYSLERSGVGAATSAGSGLAYNAGSLLGKGANAAGSAWQNILKKLGGTAAHALSSKEGSIELGAEILGPWSGPTGHTSKIDQLEFPAGLSPLQALKFSMPKLMAYMNQRNQLQQVFSQKHRRLIELNSVMDEIQFREDRSGKTWKGAAVAGGVAAGGYGTYRGVKALQPVKRYAAGVEAMGKVVPRVFPARGVSALEEEIGTSPFKGTMKLTGRMGKALYKGARHARLSAKLDDLVHI